MKGIGRIQIILIIILCFISKSLYSVLTDNAEKLDSASKAVKEEVAYTGDFVRNMNGGISTGNAYLGKFDFGLSLNTEMLGLWKGGRFKILATAVHGGMPSEKFIGDYQVASNIEAGKHQYIEELYYEHHFLNTNIKAGVQDL